MLGHQSCDISFGDCYENQSSLIERDLSVAFLRLDFSRAEPMNSLEPRFPGWLLLEFPAVLHLVTSSGWMR